ncbi:MAG: fibronectin type III domain-containing protein [Bacteroidota bacterium]
MKIVSARALISLIILGGLCVTVESAANAQCTVPSRNSLLIIQDAAARKDTIMFGHHPSATHGRDTVFCEHELPPLPPSGVFDFRFINPPSHEGQQPPGGMGQGFYFDFRPQVSLSQIDTHRVKFQPGPGGYPMTLSWSIASLLAICDSAVLKDEITGTLFTARMHTVSSLVVSNPAISSLLLIKYGAAEIPVAPVLVSPPDGSLNQSLALTLDWNNVTGTSFYRVQLSTDSLFSSTVVDDSSLGSSSRAVSSLIPGSTYYWRVRAKNGVGIGPWSGISDFTTLALPSAPVLLSPNNGATGLQTTQQLQWQSTLGATSYRAQVSTDSLFSTTIYNDSTLTTTTTNVGSLAGATTYFWRVRGKNSSGSGAWSATWKFGTVESVTNQYGLDAGWNMISLPLSVSDSRVSVQFPSAISAAFSFGTGGYAPQDTLYNGTGYWLKFAAAGNVGITGVPRFGDTLVVAAGWNLIGSTTSAIDTASIVEVPEGVVISDYFGFTAGYTAADTLQPARAYWVKAGSSGQLILPYPGPLPEKIQPAQK